MSRSLFFKVFFARRAKNVLDLPPNNLLVNKIRGINKLRNDFVHNLDKKLSSKDIKEITDDLKGIPSVPAMQGLAAVLHYIIGYLHCLKTLEKLFPFALSCARNEKLLARDKGYSYCKNEISKIYPLKEVIKIIYDLKL